MRAVGSGKVEAAGADRAAVDVGSDTKAVYAAAAVLAALQEMAGFRAVKVVAVREVGRQETAVRLVGRVNAAALVGRGGGGDGGGGDA